MEKAKVSIVIPVYNAEKYIEKCLKSVINQTLKKIEIIIINDGSKDKSEEIIREIAKKDSRIKFITRENKGVGPTRNEGIELANGEYIIFIDSDDVIEPNMCEIMYNKAKKNDVDIVICNSNIIKNGKILRKEERNEDIKVNISSVSNFLNTYYHNKLYENRVWDKMFRLSIIKENNIQFGDLKKITGEDLFFGITILPYCKKVIFIKEKLYNYYIRENSIMQTYNSQEVQKTIEFIKEIEKFQTSKNIKNEYDSFLATYIYNLVVGSSIATLRHKKKKKLKEDINYIVENETVNKYVSILNQKENLDLFKGRLKKIFVKKMIKWIIEKKEKYLYYLLIFRYYI